MVTLNYKKVENPVRMLFLIVVLLLLFAGCENPAGSSENGSENEADAGGGSDPDGDDQAEGTGPLIRLSHSESALSDEDTIDFGQLTQNDGGSAETITIYNDGDEPLTFSKIEIAGLNGENTTAPSKDGTFHWATTPDTEPLAAGASREVQIEVVYSVVEVSVTATVTVETNSGTDGVSAMTINLQAEFVEAPLEPPPGF